LGDAERDRRVVEAPEGGIEFRKGGITLPGAISVDTVV